MMKVKFKDGIDYRYTIANAFKTDGSSRTVQSGQRARFGIEKRTYDLETWKFKGSVRIENDNLDSINKLYRDGSITWDMARKNVETLIEQMYKADRAVKAQVHRPDNLAAAEAYLEKRYPLARRKKLSDFKTVEYEVYRAAECMEEVSLISGTQEQIQNQLDRFCKGDSNKQRRLVTKIKSILSVLRPTEHFELVKEHEEYKAVKYLTPEEFKEVLPNIQSEHIRVLAQVCFNLGCRIGEACALTISDLRLKPKGATVFVCKQVTMEGHEAQKIKTRTKNKKNRLSALFPDGVEPLKVWIKLKPKLSLHERKHLSSIFREACKKVFPDFEDKHLKWHDLRHSYAVRLLNEGATIKDVADMIGDSVVVAEKYYVGFIINDVRMDRILDVIKSA
jgi:integrase